ncbi:unnamed protein product [Orchesella dallaii]|uniref:Uncharacterized protein n=1 Tax=Orchesella dallaii TaxID=48710 RepID=A0ABP1RV62_9HEXA
MYSCPTSDGACALILIGIWVELGCGLVATTWTAFFNDKAVNAWAYVIFGTHFLFIAGIFHFTGKEIYYRLQKHEPKKTGTANWVLVLCTFMTACLFPIIYGYNSKILGEPVRGSNIVEDALLVFSCTLVLLTLFYISSLHHSHSVLEFHLTILSIWLQLGCVLVLTTWTSFFNLKEVNVKAYIIFGVDVAFSLGLYCYTGQEICTRCKGKASNLKAIKRVCGLCTLGTMGLMCGVYYYNTLVLGQHILQLHKIFWSSTVVYIFAILLFCLVLRKNPMPTKNSNSTAQTEEEKIDEFGYDGDDNDSQVIVDVHDSEAVMEKATKLKNVDHV